MRLGCAVLEIREVVGPHGAQNIATVPDSRAWGVPLIESG
jgi:hypothetical protein